MISQIQFYEEATPDGEKDYFDKKNKVQRFLNQITIATVTVFYNEESYTLESTLKSLSSQLCNEVLQHDLLLVGDGLEQMSTSMEMHLKKNFHLIFNLARYLLNLVTKTKN